MATVMTSDSNGNVSDFLFYKPFHNNVLVKDIQYMGDLNGSLKRVVMFFQGLVYLASFRLTLLQDLICFFERIDASGAQSQEVKPRFFGKADVSGGKREPGVVVDQLHTGWWWAARKSHIHQLDAEPFTNLTSSRFEPGILYRNGTSEIQCIFHGYLIGCFFQPVQRNI